MSRRPNPKDDVNAMTSDAPDRQFVTALARGLEILQCFDAEQRTLGTTDIAQMTGLAQPTVWRLCYTLQKTGFLSNVPGKDKLQLGTAAIALGAAAWRVRMPLKSSVPCCRRLPTAIKWPWPWGAGRATVLSICCAVREIHRC
ncbi:helix-turn-helix domain-containing protein [Advenella kashmirensis]|uniref:helix-turn-helix domain-containing protein n=1 Tax=Advenella kashmirensis TaxID=310575 RepID=UPI0011D1D0E1